MPHNMLPDRSICDRAASEVSKAYFERQNNSEYLRQRAADAHGVSDRFDSFSVVSTVCDQFNVAVINVAVIKF